VLGKEICKAQTLTNWKRRPLRKAQLHYAAMDAFVVIKIYERLLKEYGEQYLMHFVEEDELRQQVEDS
jgi:ribonuclease D